ncbi:hypothetical protein PoB_003859500 [Plakobranchus ocellatus]|uniref:N-acetyltransferase domain-containing protein n=1 Tax=Plakobranchus ocellatus TaxID=259542 RepID=A0AAV4AZ43_9GAST|nr:hypothetical protein PoB_003859500 [Plakobranchus ocellatus]
MERGCPCRQRLVTKRRRKKQYACACGLPLHLTLPDGSTVAVRPMSELQLSSTLAIRREAESLDWQPGLGVTRCLTDDDFRSEVKDFHKFAITMVTDKAVNSTEDEVSKCRGERENSLNGDKCRSKQENETKERENEEQSHEDDTFNSDYALIGLGQGVVDIDTQEEKCGSCAGLTDFKRNQASSDVRKADCADNTTDEESVSKDERGHSIKICDESIRERALLESSHSTGFSSDLQGDSSMDSGIDSNKDSFLGGSGYKRIPLHAHKTICMKCMRSTKTKDNVAKEEDIASKSEDFVIMSKDHTAAGPSTPSSGERLVASVILTDSKYFRGSFIVTPWSFVSPAYKGRGLDSLCLSISELMAKRLGFWGMYLDMLVTDVSSVSLVERKAGYVRVGTLPNVDVDSRGRVVGCHVYYKDLRTPDGVNVKLY